MTIKDLNEYKESCHQMLQRGEITHSNYLNIIDYLDDKEYKMYLAHVYGAPRELTLKEAQEIDPRYNEKLGKIKMDKEGNITVERPYPNYSSVVFYGTTTSGTHIILDGVDITGREDLKDYWFGIK